MAASDEDFIIAVLCLTMFNNVYYIIDEDNYYVSLLWRTIGLDCFVIQHSLSLPYLSSMGS